MSNTVEHLPLTLPAEALQRGLTIPERTLQSSVQSQPGYLGDPGLNTPALC